MVRLRSRPRKTVDDFMSLPEGTLAELIDGELLMTPAPRERHQTVVGRLHFAFCQYLERQAVGRVYLAPFDVHLPSGDIVEPDLMFVAREILHIVQDWIRGVPDLLVEVVSPSHPERDRLIKRALYVRNGLRELWIADPEEKSVEIISGGQSAGYFRGTEPLVSPLLPGLTICMADLFAP